MNLWKLEWLRLLRTRRILILFAVFVIFGFGEPLLIRYLPDIISHSSNANSSNLKITVVSKPTATEGFTGYINEVSGLGLIVTLILAAYSLAIDAKVRLSTYYRTRTTKATDLLLPRFTVITVATLGAFIAGTLTAWYETTAVLGHSAAPSVIAGMLLTCLYWIFCIATVALAASIVRSIMATVGLAFAILVLAGLLTIQTLDQWNPATLATSMNAILSAKHTASFYLKPSLVTVGFILLFLAIALLRIQTREVEE